MSELNRAKAPTTELETSEQLEASIHADHDALSDSDSLLRCVAWLCGHYKLSRSIAALCAGLPKSRKFTPSLALQALANAGLTGGIVERAVLALPTLLLPVVLLRKDHGGCMLLGFDSNDEGETLARVWMPELGDAPALMTIAELNQAYSGFAILVKPQAMADGRAGEPEPEAAGHWLLRTLWRYKRAYLSAALATLLINLLALSGTFFTMNVYDRVVPNNAFVTLWSLAIGVSCAMLFEFLARFVRAYLLDLSGKKADLIMGSMLFRQALSVRMEHKPASTGAFANQLREFESVRDFATSATLASIADLPFTLLFVGVIFMIGGPLGWIPLMMIPIIIIVSVIIQWPLARAMKENLQESSLKQGVLIEAIDGMEALKAVSGEGFMQQRWERYSALSSATSMKSKRLSTLTTNFFTFMQQFETVIMVVVGVYLIKDGSLTQGALIGSVMLASRAIAPLGQVVGLAVRFQQAKAALTSLNRLMEMPIDRDPQTDYLPKPELTGQITLQEVKFAYPAVGNQPTPTILQDINLQIRSGERVAMLGRVGSGKSTLLRLIARLYLPVEGKVLCDGIDAAQVDPADWRRAVGYVGQDSRLFYGTLRQNITIGHPGASAAEIMRVLQLVGLEQMVRKHPLGINLPVGEMGQSLSGGQRQLVALARCLLCRPKLLLLDEPTSAMDSQTESKFMEHLARSIEGQTVLIVTHRPSLLALVERIIVIDDGKVVSDGLKTEVLAALAAPAKKAA
ncbi:MULTISPECIES: type I secretion system permease/ATPase [unclassified Undibacterium]|nr:MULTISPECIES: type I secretion system permease/ATPase [unclassified Undibacterium]MEB0140017.1 type I secretion system permease/ATPase [Undibacterium sp. CCC2.1]MEB0173070.1 type I secretion system permease/ATPase [Undibacterium sp. CCC1.1]MEB0176882.1 type I secretion system permease/ATPase [Undibacterium sp. CCC3.4]MEB0216114.1 type I secretion system permease/ATPase [Undibacterium sp. 5I2]WPX42003.1 type I secretion system permease/ATPase [Undibacterium sp. CCC3.4]